MAKLERIFRENDGALNPIRVVIVDDYPIVRDGLRLALGTDPKIEVVGVFASGEQMLAQVKRLSPEIVLMDIGLRGISGIETTSQLRQKHPTAKVIILTVHEDQQHLAEAVQAGAVAYLLKDISPKKLRPAVRDAWSGQSPMASSMTRPLLKQLVSITEQGTVKKPDLSERQLEILRLIATGASNQEMAARLFFSIATIKMEINRIFAELNVSNRTQAIAEAYQRKLL